MTYAADLIVCGHCGRRITGELKIKQSKAGPQEYLYYRCSQYNKPGHPRTRVTESDLDRQVLAMFDRMRIEDEGVRDWFRAVPRKRATSKRNLKPNGWSCSGRSRS